MKVKFSTLPFLVFLWLTVAPTSAAPAANCASKFVGSWIVRVDATGQTYPSQILTNGKTHVTCPMCTPGGSWTCSGNTITVNVDNGVTTQHTLHADGRTMSGGCCTITRVGAAPPVLSSDSKQPSSRQQLPVGVTKDLHPKGDQGKSTRLANTAQPAAPLNPVYSKSASCSDITGTNSAAPAAGDCKDASTFLHSARVIRKQYPEYAEEQYKKAAAAARRAGDTNLELSILREATVPAAPEPRAPDPASDDACAALMREAAADITGAQAIERNDPSCAGLLHAAENYFSAGRIFFGSIKPGMSSDQVVNSCANKKTNEMFLRRDALIYRVDRMREAGKCDPAIAANPPPPPPPPPPPDEDLKKKCAEKLQILTPHAVNDQWLKDQMATGEVKCNADGTPM